jgi:hypothetical protein
MSATIITIIIGMTVGTIITGTTVTGTITTGMPMNIAGGTITIASAAGTEPAGPEAGLHRPALFFEASCLLAEPRAAAYCRPDKLSDEAWHGQADIR